MRFFQSPLERALTAYYLKLAIADLKKTDFKDGVPAGISIDGTRAYVPQRVNVDLGQFTRSIGNQYPGLCCPTSTVSSYGYSERDFQRRRIAKLIGRMGPTAKGIRDRREASVGAAE